MSRGNPCAVVNADASVRSCALVMQAEYAVPSDQMLPTSGVQPPVGNGFVSVIGVPACIK